MVIAFTWPAISGIARADQIDRCLSSHAEAQRLRIAGKLRTARQELLVCASQACPRLVRTECGIALQDVTGELPSVVVRTEDGKGREVESGSVRIIVDGAVTVDVFRGLAIDVDPGQHLFRFEVSGKPAVEQNVMIRQGEKNRTLVITFPDATRETPAPSPSTPSRRMLPVASLVLGGIGVAGGGLFAVLAASARSDVEHLRATCSPACAHSDVATVREKLIAANVALGIGAGAFVGAVWLFALRRTPDVASRVDVVPSSHGAVAAFRGAF
jgi:hypothetical protein